MRRLLVHGGMRTRETDISHTHAHPIRTKTSPEVWRQLSKFFRQLREAPVHSIMRAMQLIHIEYNHYYNAATSEGMLTGTPTGSRAHDCPTRAAGAR